ncbi:tetratricopeptide repeat protein [Actinocorallia aurea]
MPEGIASPFVSELQRMLADRGMSWRRLADLMGYHPSWLSKVRHGSPPSADFVRRCDEALGAGGRLIALAAVRDVLRPAQIPVPPARFVGRQRELRRMREVLVGRAGEGTPRVVIVHGPPGAGKTALALRCAHELRHADGGHFPDGELFVNLHGYSDRRQAIRAEDVLEELLLALGVSPGGVPAGGERRAGLFRSVLAQSRVLIVLDNASSSAQVEPLLPGAPGSGVVVTSRKMLASTALQTEAASVELGAVTRADAVAILAAAIPPAVSAAQRPQLETLADQCGCLPLALRIVAERLVVRSSRQIGDLVEELSEQRLDALSSGDSPPLRSVFEWSYQELAPPERRMFRLLGLHPGAEFDDGAAAALAGVPVVDARRLLERLRAVHLIEDAPHGRHQFHDLLKAYADDRVRADETEAERVRAQYRLSAWYLRCAAAAGRLLAPFRRNELGPPDAPGVPVPELRDAAQALRWCDLEAESFTPVLAVAADLGFHEVAWKLGVALFDYLRLLRVPGRLWLDATGTALRAARAAGDPYAQAWVETSMAEACRWLGQYDRAARLFERALAVRRLIEDRPGEGWTLAGLGFLAVDRDRLEEAGDWARAAMAAFRKTGDLNGVASALFTLADVHQGQGRFDEALRALDESMAIFAEIGNSDGAALTATKRADVHLAQGRPQQALAVLDSAIEARRAAGSRWGEADGLVRRARVLHGLGLAEPARRSLVSAADLYETVDAAQAVRIRAYLRDADPAFMSARLPPVGW